MSAGAAFQGRCAIVTGAARGMGAAAVRHFVGEGGRVAMWDISSEGLDKARCALPEPESAMTVPVDISDETDVARALDQTVREMGQVDILVNCAGIAGVNAHVENFPVDVWRKVLDVNLTGAFLCCREVIPVMKKAGYGRIVNVASVAGKEGNPNASAYSASKAGMIALTKCLGKEVARDGITVNVITPAVIETEMLKDVSREQLDYMLSKIPMGRPGTVQEVADMIAFLSSDKAGFSTAAVFDMTGGRSTY